MWQDAAQTQNGMPQQGTAEHAEPGKAGKSGKSAQPQAERNGSLLWGQIVLCGLILAFAAASRQMQLPWYRELRSTYHQLMAADSSDFFFDGRRFIKFTQEALVRVQGQAQPAQAERGRSRRSRNSEREAPYGSSTESYLPTEAAVYPLGNTAATNSGYGWRISPSVLDSDEDFHTGDDLNAAEGAPVYATMDGIVRAAAYGASYGNYIRILHENGTETLYAHLQYIFARGGERVQGGQCIGTVGQTGKATGPHLHFELLNGGVRYDPTAFLQGLCG